MPLYICSLNSGSNGNCYYIGNQYDAVLVDAGISCRETEKRMDRSGLDIGKVRAVFISHEHTDHTRGAEVISRKHRLPVYFSKLTHLNSRVRIRPELLKYFGPHKQVEAGTITVTAFPKNHDASEPHSFIVTSQGITVGVMTDAGIACEHIISNFEKCHAAFLEANYDDEMLRRGRYPEHLKRRIRSNEGHLSNLQALDLFVQHKPAFMSHLVLSHLSQENNDPAMVLELFRQHAGLTRIEVASRFRESPVFEVNS